MNPSRIAFALLPLVTACTGGAGTPSSHTPASPRGHEEVHGDAPSSWNEDSADEAPGEMAYREAEGRPSAAPAAGDGESRGALAPRDERPGLATHWGESRHSPTTSVEFERSHPTRPTDTVTIAYDDMEGVRVMTGREPPHDAVVALAGGALTVTLADSHGSALPAWSSGRRIVAAGEPGERYQIRVDNHTPRRFEIVATVDGLDVIDGGDGAFEKRGYLIGAWATVEIEGFRRSEDEVAAFRFGDVEGSYAVARGRGRDIGVIGVAAFVERGQDDVELLRREREVQLRRDADPFPGSFAPPPGALRVR